MSGKCEPLSPAIESGEQVVGFGRPKSYLAIPGCSRTYRQATLRITVQSNGKLFLYYHFYVQLNFSEVRQVDFVIMHKMDPAPKPTYRDKLFKSMTRILEIAKGLGSNEMIDTVSLGDFNAT
jgi:hypothetical protein